MRDDTLSEHEKEHLSEHGYLMFPGLLTPSEIQALAGRIEELEALEGENAGREWYREPGVVRLCNLLNKGEIFERCITHPRVLAAVCHVLGGRFKLSALDSRNPLPGQGRQSLHVDWFRGVDPGDYYVCNTAWLLDPFTRENGAPRLVPGTHLSGKMPAEVMADPRLPCHGQIRLLAEAGTVIVFNSHVWHGGLGNGSDAPRRTLYAYFCRRDQRQELSQQEWLDIETRRRLSPEARAIVDVDDL